VGFVDLRGDGGAAAWGIGVPVTSPTIKPIKGVLNIRPNERIEWTKAMHNQAGNIGLADGSACQATPMQLSKQFQAEINSTTQAVHRIALTE
jgi:hypothetical protein